MSATSYDRVVYPTGVFAQAHPERLAVSAKLHGLDPVDPAKARILEIGGGNSMNLISIASAYPECEAHGVDLSETAIAKGQEFVDAAGLGNVHLAVDDIREAHNRYPAKSFDYVISHGVYAWVEPDVAKALMALVGHVLADRGVAILSYNCMPGEARAHDHARDARGRDRGDHRRPAETECNPALPRAICAGPAQRSPIAEGTARACQVHARAHGRVDLP
jgi:trans-aconitate methyltransferase